MPRPPDRFLDPIPGEPPRRRFLRLYRHLTRNRQGWQVFSDFCALSALALANRIVKDDGREAEYMRLIGRYEELDDRLALREMLGCVVTALSDSLALAGEDSRPAYPAGDFLGSLFMELELSSHWHGQFFTPYTICEMMARMTYGRDDMQRHVDQDGFVTVLEPACGAGAMVIAFADVMREYGFTPHQHMHAVAVDIHETAAHMCFIQLSVLGIPASVYVGNSLSNEMRSVFHTPAHILGGWDLRLALRRSSTQPCSEADDDAESSRTADDGPPADAVADEFTLALLPARQMDLFAA